MTDIALTNLDRRSNAEGGPFHARIGTTPVGNDSSTSREALSVRLSRTVTSLRTALPASQGSSHFNDENSAHKPRFGDLSPYNITDQDEKFLWETEVNRIISGLDKTQRPIDSAQCPELAANINNLGFTWLETFSDQLLCALSICGLDDNLQTKPEARTGMSSRGSVIGRSFDRLQTRLGKAPDAVRRGGRRQPSTSRREYSDPYEGYVVRDGVSAVASSKALLYYYLVDYITETVARLLCGSFSSDEIAWVSFIVTMLAKYSTKLKVLSGELPEHAARALERHSDTRKLLNLYPFTAAENPSEIHLDLNGIQNRDSDRDLASGRDGRYIATYASDMIATSNWIFRLLWNIFKDLNTRNTRNRETDEFEVSAVVFQTGSRGTPANAFQNRRGHISGSSSGAAVGMSRRATDLLSDTARIIHDRTREGLELMTGVSRLFIKAGNPSGEQDVKLKFMGELISVMVISSCMDPCVTDDMVSLCASLRVSHILSKIYQDLKGYTAFVCLYNSLSPRRPSELQRSRRRLAETVESNGSNGVTPQTSEVEPSPRQYDLEAIKAVEKEILASTRQSISISAAKWAVEEHAISVSCLPYTLKIMSGCAILVLGGLMAGLFVGTRIDGVDPFNLTMFAWIIAGFIILVSKSIRVGEWTWKDFLKGRVTCRTVRELASVTSLPEQSIIMHLLSSEKETPLVFRGPYNNVFSNTGAEGFSVDVKPTIGTLFASGLIVLEVLLESGSALVCLDIRPHVIAMDSSTEDSRYKLGTVAHGLIKQRMVHRQREECRVLACKDPPLPDETEKDIVFRQQRLHWEKIIGVYNRPTQSVR